MLHFSEDPTITEFVPHVAATARQPEPLGTPEQVGDLFALHEAAGIQLRVLGNLWDFWDAVVASTLGFSGIRLGNAVPRPTVRAAGRGRTRTRPTG